MEIKQIIRALVSGSAVSGTEFFHTEAENMLKKYADVKRTASGSIIASVGSGKTHIMLDAHLDRIGLIVTAIDKSGFLRVDKCGGCDARVLCAAEVTVWGKKPLYGVITSTPPHLAGSNESNDAPSFDTIYIDLGMPFDEIKKHVSVGDRITVDAPFMSLSDNIITGAALDDRIGMAAIIRVLDILEEKKPNVKITVLFSAQEETTQAGAKTGSFEIDADEAICVDVSFAMAPGIKATQAATLGKGGMICISPSLASEISNDLIALAEKNKIKFQTEICPSSTGTNADVIFVSKSGVRTGLVSIPIRNMHTQAELADIRDIESTAQIIAAYILTLGGKNDD